MADLEKEGWNNFGEAPFVFVFLKGGGGLFVCTDAPDCDGNA